MPHIDKRSGSVVIRIVYDGAPEAGKTTNVARLGQLISLQRKGAAKSPGTTGTRTEFFDWLDFAGGYVDGRRVQCQLVSVPGQASLLHRRRYLLETADAVVLVSDSRPSFLTQALDHSNATRKILERQEHAQPVGLVWQANKQDLEGALPPAEVARVLGLGADVPVVGSIAERGEGVMQTFVLAVRLATDRVRALLLDDGLGELPSDEANPESLHRAMLELEPKDAVASFAHPSPARAAPPRSPTPPRTNRVAERWPLLPRASEIASGHVWPPVKGRAWLARMTRDELHAPDAVCPWAPEDALEWQRADGWVLHTTDRWLYPEEAQARRKLFQLVRALLEHPERIPEGRAIAAAPDHQGYRIWLVTPPLPNAKDRIQEALTHARADDLFGCIQQLLTAATAPTADRLRSSPGGLEGLALGREGLSPLWLGDEETWPRSCLRDPLDELVAMLESSSPGSPPMGELEADGLRMLREGLALSPPRAPLP